jgi:hypothetical protein
LWGPVRSSTKKNSYIMVVTNAFTKFATAVAIPGKEAMHVAPALLSHFYTFGMPMQLVTDQGREYCNELEKAPVDRIEDQARRNNTISPSL